MIKKKEEVAQNVSAVTEPIATARAGCEDDLQTLLAEVKKFKGVTGFILRNQSSAFIDLEDSDKLADYALLSSLAFDASKDFSEVFDLGEIRNIFLNGKNIKILSVNIGENQVSVFMKKGANVERVLEKLQTS
jgi:predicted regulator of Ras-like GTPase activity (Roadblock/LC7/MglB family)